MARFVSPSIARRRPATVGVIALALAVTMVLPAGDKALDAVGAAPPRSEAASPAGPPLTAPVTAPAPTSTTAPAAPPGTRIATSRVETITTFTRPTAGAAVLTRLSRTTDYGVPRTFLVVDDPDAAGGAADAHPGWLRVLLPVRPNGTTGWIAARDVTLATTDYSVTVQLGLHRVTVYEGDRTVLQTGAVIGSPATPTPRGTFYVTDPVDRRDAPDTVYGAFALGLSGFSEVLAEFEGGPAQIALHGTNRPDQLGQEISNGCIRVPDETIVEIAGKIPVGTPVHIVA
jgi:lipoprotein-anchoring transpeptidase ErfK/SrfK